MRRQTSFFTVSKPASLEQSALSQAVKIRARLSQYPTLSLPTTSEPMIELNITFEKFSFNSDSFSLHVAFLKGQRQ